VIVKYAFSSVVERSKNDEDDDLSDDIGKVVRINAYLVVVVEVRY
jgi:hypothetical protein